MHTRVIIAKNVNYALREALWWMRVSGVRRTSRNGPVIVAPGPVITEYLNPRERLVACPRRDANHVFHLMETIWMLAGRRDVTWLLPFNSKFSQYAEDDGVQHGAYGHRWRSAFAIDQLGHVRAGLREPDNRRVVLQMWNATTDLGMPVRDVPCNTQAYFQLIDGSLHMTVTCRSNDAIWGAYGANAVHFSMLQELLARDLGAHVGPYIQFSNNFHIYTEFGPGAALLEHPSDYDMYSEEPGAAPLPLLAPTETMWDFIHDCEAMTSQPAPILRTEFMRRVAWPLKVAYLMRKDGDAGWRTVVDQIPDCDWKLAFLQWTERRKANA